MAIIRNDALRIPIIGLLMIAGCSLLLARLWWVQIEQGSDYAKRVRGVSQATVRIPAIRGEIRDRNGVTLVENHANYQVDFYLPDVVSGYRRAHGKVPINKYEVNVRGFEETREEADILTIVKEGIITRLEELGLAKDFNATQMRRHFRNNTHVPYTYLDSLDFETLARFAENDLGLPGVKLDVRPVRHYRYGALAAHLLGIVGPAEDISSQPDVAEFNFYDPDPEGRSNVEQFMDPYLRGKPGIRILKRNPKGVIEGEIGMQPPTPGANVYLTIDARVQMIAEQALRAVGRGAAVVIDPRNGDILAMASVPSFDPNVFVPKISNEDWSMLNDDLTNPLLNRAISPYAPGSTYKIMIALAGLKAGINPNSRPYNCSGGVTYGNKLMRCMGSHGSLNLADAIMRSCNSYFYQFGNTAGIENIVEVGNLIGFGNMSNIEVSGEKTGIMPGPKWLAGAYPRERWSSGHTANVSIGQGAVLTTPLQMASLAATVANGGTVYRPRLIDKVVDYKNQTLVKEQPKVLGHLSQLGLTPEQIEVVRNGMYKVVNDGGGTARRAQIKNVAVAGKTGTAENYTIRNGKTIKDNHAWFIAFAPYKDPELAVAVIVEGARSGGGVAAPIAARIIDETLALQRGYNPPLEPLAPAKGSFLFVNGVDFASAVPAQFGADTSGEVSVGPDPAATAAQTAAQSGGSAGNPSIRAAADREGRVNNAAAEKRPSFLQRMNEAAQPKPGATPRPRRHKR